MSWSNRRAFAVASLVFASVTFASCSGSNGTSNAVGTSGQTDSAIGVATSPRGVTVENRGSQHLADVKVSVSAAGSSKTYDQMVATLAPSERKELALSNFKTSENVALNAMFSVPQQITVTATDDEGKMHTVTVPWK